MIFLQKIFLATVPLSTCITTLSMLLPYWWSSENVQVGLWRARSISSPWIKVEPQLETSEGRLLYTLQILSVVSVILTDITAMIWLILLIFRNYQKSLSALISLFVLTILNYFCLSIILFFVWFCNHSHLPAFRLSYSFYLTLAIIVSHTITLVSLTMNLAQYRNDHHIIQPCQTNEKLKLAFSEAIV